MEMHELESAWKGLDERLQLHETLLREVRRRDGVDVVRARLRMLTVGQAVQVAIGLVIVMLAGSWWTDHLDAPHLVVYGVSIHLWGIGLLITAGMQLAAIARLDFRAPVLDMQRQLLKLRRLRVRSERWLLMAGFVVWVPVVFAIAAAAGYDAWIVHPANVLLNLAVGILMAGIVAWLIRRYPDRFARDAAGRSLREAEAEIAELAGEDGRDS